MPHVALRVWGKSLLDGTVEGARPSRAEAARSGRGGMGTPVLRPGLGNPFLPGGFGEAREAASARSRWCRSARRGTIGLLALGSEDPQRFFAEMGSLYLRRIGELTAGALAARTCEG